MTIFSAPIPAAPPTVVSWGITPSDLQKYRTMDEVTLAISLQDLDPHQETQSTRCYDGTKCAKILKKMESLSLVPGTLKPFPMPPGAFSGVIDKGYEHFLSVEGWYSAVVDTKLKVGTLTKKTVIVKQEAPGRWFILYMLPYQDPGTQKTLASSDTDQSAKEAKSESENDSSKVDPITLPSIRDAWETPSLAETTP